LNAGGLQESPEIGPAGSAAGSDNVAEAEVPFGVLAHKVHEINRLLCIMNTIFTQFAQSG
jgi:hypothetical protein